MDKTPEPQAKRRPTVSDVAALSGVSIGTVSKALSGRGAVRHETRQRILEAARGLNYFTPTSANSESATATNTIGVITGDQFGRLTVPVLLGALNAFAEKELAILICDGRGDPIREQHFVDSFVRRRVDGILVTGPGMNPREPLKLDAPFPVVYALSWSTNPSDSSVVPDDTEGARMATRHLLATGRTKFAFISGPEVDSIPRLNGTRDALAEGGLALVHEALFGEWTERWGRQSVRQLMRSGAKFDAIVCGSDQVARGVLEALRDNGVDVPHEVGVIGFDNWDVMVEASRPPLSTVDLGLSEVGRVSARMLMDAIAVGTSDAGIKSINCRVVPRDSTGVSDRQETT